MLPRKRYSERAKAAIAPKSSTQKSEATVTISEFWK